MTRRRSRTLRILAAAVLGLTVVALLGFAMLDQRHASPAASDLAGLDHSSCQRCHQEVWHEWESSQHARAWSDATVQASFGTFGFDRKCQSCHAAEPTLLSPGEEPVLRTVDVESGVNCLTCHELADGAVAARRTIADAPCRPTASPLLVSSASCAACHVSAHKDWSASSFAADGQECSKCHMPALAAESTRRSHSFLGGHDDATVRSGVRMESVKDAQEIIVRVTNHATGHNFPGERHHRTLLVQIIERADDGEVLLSQQDTIKSVTPFRGEASSEKIRSGQTNESRFPIVEQATVAEVKLLYKLFPWYTDAEALVVTRQEVKLAEP